MDNIASRILQLKPENVCRTCLSKECLRPLFPEDHGEDSNIELTAAILAVTQLEVKKDDGLPEVICETCQHIVMQAHHFIARSHEADTLLRENLRLTQDTDVKTEPNEEYAHWEDVSELASLEDDISTIFEDKFFDKQGMKEQDKKSTKKCSMCNKEYKFQKALNNHMAKDHAKRKRGRPRKDAYIPSQTKESPITTKKSQTKTKTRSGIKITQQDIEETDSVYKEIEINTQECDIKIQSVRTIDQSEMNTEESDNEPTERKRKRKRAQSFKCWFCTETFDNNKEVIKHYEAHHYETEVYLCNKCDCIYLEYETLKKHGPCVNLKKDETDTNHLVDKVVDELSFSTVLLHSVLRPGDFKAKSTIMECEDCGCLLWSKADLKLHVDERHADKSLRCNLCSKELTTLRNALRHKATCDGTPETVYQCADCGQEFRAELSFNKHILSMHSGAKASVTFLDKKKPPNPDQNMYSCDECNASFSRRELLTGHMKHEHRTKYECDICQRKFSRIYNLWSHARVHDPNLELKLLNRARPKDCLCNFCGQGFSNTSNLIVHVRRHTGEKPYKCDFCDKAYPRSYDLAVHRRTHTGEKPCACPICGKSFSRSNKLTRHMHTHTGQKPYKCDYCDKAFAQSNDLHVHKRRHTGDKPYCCEICGDRFINGSALQSHRRQQGHHPPTTSVHPPSGYMPLKQTSTELLLPNETTYAL